jgi:4'-phosphopantetheinyl transferase EntD
LFSAKESVYKAWFPLTQRLLDFPDVNVRFALERGAFDAELVCEAPRVEGALLRAFRGRFCVDHDYVGTFALPCLPGSLA